MPTSIEPRSEMRISHNICFGYGEVPGWVLEGTEDSEYPIVIYGLPGGRTTYDSAVASNMAIKIDWLIRQTKTNPIDLMHSAH